MCRPKAIAARLICCLLGGWLALCAQALAEELSILELGDPVQVNGGLVGDDGDGDYAKVTDSEFDAANAADISFLPRSVEEEGGPPELIPAPYSPADDCESCSAVVDPDCCDVPCRRGWIVELGASALQSDMATSDLEAWPEDYGAAGRISIGYEWDSGLGIRTQAWGYSMEGYLRSQSPLAYSYDSAIFYSFFFIPGALNRPLYYYPQSFAYSRRIDLSASTVYLDFYKVITSRHGEFAVGMGPAFGNLEFNFPPAGDGMQYYGGGVTAFAQGHLPFIMRGRWELGMTGRTRATLLTGSWDIDIGGSASQRSENMSILELAVGPEIRRRLGSSDDRYLFLRTLAEFQQWRSDRMGPIAGDTLGLQGVSLDFGLLW